MIPLPDALEAENLLPFCEQSLHSDDCFLCFEDFQCQAFPFVTCVCTHKHTQKWAHTHPCTFEEGQGRPQVSWPLTIHFVLLRSLIACELSLPARLAGQWSPVFIPRLGYRHCCENPSPGETETASVPTVNQSTILPKFTLGSQRVDWAYTQSMGKGFLEESGWRPKAAALRKSSVSMDDGFPTGT